jgi:tyrosyl-tRNA synthetase
MGKTERGAVWLSAKMVPVFDYYQYWISCDDRDVRKLLLMFTDLPVEEVEQLGRLEGAHLREAKTRLAFEATKLVHGEDEAHKAQAAAVQAFGGGEDWSAVPAAHMSEEQMSLLDLVVDPRVAAFKSKREARQRIESGAVRIDARVCRDPGMLLHAREFEDSTLRLQAGKRCRVRVVLGSIG